MAGFEENEISVNANGGTEITKRTISKHVDAELVKEFQIIASRVRDLEEDKIRVYWQHDLPEDPEISHLKDENSRNRFHKFVFVSNWQLNEYHNKLGFPLSEKVQVIENAVDPIEAHVKPTDKINLVYFSTPQRGLEILIPVFEALTKKYDNIHLDVFSSFNIYGWVDADKIYEPLFERIRNHPQMTYHGFVDQPTIREHLKKAHILAYPNIWKETSCRVLIESMSAGLLCVHPNLGALSDTSGGLTTMYQFYEDVNKHANEFYLYLDHAIRNVSKTEAQNYLKFAKTYADVRFNTNKIASQWENVLKDLLVQYPDSDSRKLLKVTENFVYNTQ